MTRRATEIGCGKPRRNATPPQRDGDSMITVSSVTSPDASGIPPYPTLVTSGSASTARQAASTASSTLAPSRDKTSQPARLAILPKCHVLSSR